jgi:hypothetical protein
MGKGFGTGKPFVQFEDVLGDGLPDDASILLFFLISAKSAATGGKIR